jgi:hypothetical protein
LALVVDAARRGRAYLEHADGVRTLQRAQTACRSEVHRLAQQALTDWSRSVEEARSQPQRQREQCVQTLARIDQLRQAQSAGPVYLLELDRRIAELATPPAAGDPAALNAQRCGP